MIEVPHRLTPAQQSLLKEAIYKQDPQALVYLFGSRTDATKQGGDIDILILSQTLSQRELREIRYTFFQAFGEQRLDILLDTPDIHKTFTKVILEKAIPL